MPLVTLKKWYGANALCTALWESLACHPTIWISWLYHFLTDDLKGNLLTGVTFDPFVTQKCNGTQNGSSINQKFIPNIRMWLKWSIPALI